MTKTPIALIILSIVFPAAATALSCANKIQQAAISEHLGSSPPPPGPLTAVEVVFSAGPTTGQPDVSETQIVLRSFPSQNSQAYGIETRPDGDDCDVLSVGAIAMPVGLPQESSVLALCAGRIKRAALLEFMPFNSPPGGVAQIAGFRLRERNGRINGQITLQRPLGEERSQKVYLAFARQIGNGDDCEGLSIEERRTLGTSRSH